ncbi:MAG: lysophospholipid acyltransferase family protein [Bacteroidota bacterium]|nr:lysophospholipid acyltransferase family protein [Bacteroidota bacterium]
MDRIIYLIVYPYLFLISRMPFNILYAFSDITCFFVYRIIRYRRNIVRSNLMIAFPEYEVSKIKEIEKKFYSHFCDIFLEIIKSMGMSKADMLERFNVQNIGILKFFEKEKRSIFLICGHYSSWEWMMSLGYHIKHKGYGIYRPIRNRYFDRLINKIRRCHNSEMIPQKKAVEIIKSKELKKELGVYGFASDQSPRPKSSTYWINFLGKKVPAYSGAESLSRDLNIPVVFSKINRIKRGYYNVEFKVISSFPKNTKKSMITNTYTKWLEKQIFEDPSQYLWTHKRFKFSQ